jgi:site-specific DNA-methyltransferase (adenine-specific)/site-specific DNA-methyltransferase (cytosine-N4-specific)
MELVLAHAKQWAWHFATEFCWERTGLPGLPARRFKNQFEPIYQFALNDWKFNPDAVRHDSSSVPTYSSDSIRARGLKDSQGLTGKIWANEPEEGLAYPGNRLQKYKSEALGHAAAFPIGLPEFFIKAYSDEGDAIYDPFMGSGSTIIAAHNNNRVGYGVELSPAYCDVICRRFQDATAITPILEATGESVSFVGFSDE